MSTPQMEHVLRLLAAASESARRAREEVDTAYSALRGVAAAEAAEQDALRDQLRQQQQQQQQQQLEHQQELQQQLEQQHQQHQQELQQQHEQQQQQQLAQQQQHEQQLAAAVAAATAAEKARLRGTVGPTLLLLQASEQRQTRRVAVLEAELDETRAFVFEALANPRATRRRLGF